MTIFIAFSRDQAFLLPADDVAHFVVEAVERLPLSAFAARAICGGKAQYHPRLMLALLIYSYAHGIFSSRRIERATHRDIGVRYVVANLHPVHDTIAAFRRTNRVAFEAAFLQVLLLARESGLLRLGTVSIDGTKLDANASKIRSVRYDRAKELRAKLATDIAELTARAEAEAARPEHEAKQAIFDAKKGRRGRPPKPLEDDPPPTHQSNLTDPDSALMRRSNAHEYRQAYNAQAVVCPEGSQLILATGVVATSADAPSFCATILGMEAGIGLPKADTGFASGKAVAAPDARGIKPLVAIGRTQPHRPYDFRPPPQTKTLRPATV